MIKKFFGLNIAVKDLDEAVKRYSAVFGKATLIDPKEFAFPGLKGATVKVGEISINLIASDQPGTSIARFLETKGEGVFLVSVQVDDVAGTMKQVEPAGVQFVSKEPMPFGIDKQGRVNFAHPRSMFGVQWEFIQPKE
ncbi:MAG: VOC family protein [Chloroflexi bacterium]|nr:VOC family protein [Chloroflexota bacterium]